MTKKKIAPTTIAAITPPLILVLLPDDELAAGEIEPAVLEVVEKPTWVSVKDEVEPPSVTIWLSVEGDVVPPSVAVAAAV